MDDKKSSLGDKYPAGSLEHAAYMEGREYRMENNVDEMIDDDPYWHQPHTAKLSEAWQDGFKDEGIWALDSTGR